MPTIEGRVSALERASAPATGPLLVFVGDELTEAQRAAVQAARRSGRVVVLLDRLDLEL